MRAGAGYVTACVPASLQAILATAGPPELMTRGLPDEDGGLTAEGVEERARRRASAAGRWRWDPGWDAAMARSRLRASSRARRRSRWCSTPTG